MTSYLLGETDDPEPSGVTPTTPFVNVGNTTNSTIQAAGHDFNATPTPKAETFDLSGITPFVLQLKEQGNIDKIQDAIDILESSLSMLKRAVPSKQATA